MGRCNATENLEVHHIRRDRGNDLENAKVLCHRCHENTDTYGRHGENPPDFSEETRRIALERAGNRCECERVFCHIGDDEEAAINEVLSEGR
jgi:5-methylcytosine-specific restriction endonuclease McrA